MSVLIRNTLEFPLGNKPTPPNLSHKIQSLRIITIRPIHAEQNAIKRRLTDQARKRREGEHPRRSHPDITRPDLAQAAPLLRPTRFRLPNVDFAVEEEGEAFAHVADDELDGGELVEKAAVEEAEDVEAYFLVWGNFCVSFVFVQVGISDLR